MLVLGIRYLNGFSAASESDNYDCAEWPPHPGRVFMAMVAAHFQTGADPEERVALEWLEGLEQAPVIQAPEGVERKVVTSFVPVNPRLEDEKKQRNKEAKDGKMPPPPLQSASGIIRTRQPRTFARTWLESDILWLTWPNTDTDDGTRQALARLCAKVTRIGHSTSLVQMWVAEDAETREPNWIPDEDGGHIRLRIATSGTLKELERRYNGEAVETFAALKAAAEDDSDKKAQKTAKKRLKEEFGDEEPFRLRPQLSMTHGYARPSAREKAEAPGSVFDPHLRVLRMVPKETAYRHLDLVDAPVLAQRWREALISKSDGLSDSVREILSGHDSSGGASDKPHLAFVPLAYAGSEHADGHLQGMGLTLPGDASREDRRAVLKLVSEVRELKLGRLGIWKIEPETREQPPLNLRAEVWTAHPKGATHWSTVTPVVYDRHPKTGDKATYLAEAADMIRKSCVRIGLSEPREVIVTPVSAHLGVPPAHVFPRLQRKDGSRRRHAHVILVFREPVCGPILLGAGRFRGYGVCKPMQEAE